MPVTHIVPPSPEDEAAREAVEHALAALGQTLPSVATKLKELKIKGVPGNGRNCPIANYLKTTMPDGWRLRNVHPLYVTVNKINSEPYHGIVIGVPDAVNAFIHSFDFHVSRYPELAGSRVPEVDPPS